ncbi:Ger(x)C family spore germination protein [Paenibacillus eucommiae]|uniref:Ger(X)C family germination protein n=1 Tax=Paenibacillus eucommiae TaxID=1355755 RepID=A0ABS4J5M2_9BACL|nr:Ger(x)C family spore germination protein [Paenibacillus eucommiae]MBP1995135.1 Ger(x)C family germination protein [Paenibacillus eucommiae]
MNKQWRRLTGFLLIVMVVAIVPGCYDRLDLEEASSPFLVGYDLDENNNMIVYVTDPVFSKNVGKKTHEIRVEASTSRDARDKEDARSPGVVHGRKIQIILIGKRMLEHADWFRILDVFFRDARNSLTPRVVAYNGPLSEIIYLNPKDQPMMPMLLTGMVDTKSSRSETVKTTLQELHRQMFEKGMTPYIPEVKVEKKEIVLQGTTLLDHKGKFATALTTQETVLLQMLQKEAKKTVSLTIPIPGKKKIGPFHTDRLSFNTQKVQTQIKTSYPQDHFQFDIHVKMRVTLTEVLFAHKLQDQEEQLEKMLTGQVQKQMDNLISRLKKHRIDPIGLGLHARAHEYEHYKKAEDHWGEAIAESDIKVVVSVEIGSGGPVK